MNRGAIPQQQDFARQVTVQRPQESDNLGALDGAGVQVEVEVLERETGDGRQAFPVEVEGQDRGLAAGRPGANTVGALAQSAFVEEDEGASFPAGFFLRRGHWRVFQSAILASSRSRARPTGRRGLKPS